MRSAFAMTRFIRSVIFWSSSPSLIRTRMPQSALLHVQLSRISRLELILLSHACPCAGWFDAYAARKQHLDKKGIPANCRNPLFCIKKTTGNAGGSKKLYRSHPRRHSFPGSSRAIFRSLRASLRLLPNTDKAGPYSASLFSLSTVRISFSAYRLCPEASRHCRIERGTSVRSCLYDAG